MMISLEPTVWVRSPRPLQQAHYRLFCLPYGGGDATLFHDWPNLLPTSMREYVEICTIHLPGRTHRINERPLFTTISSLVDSMVPPNIGASVLYPYLDRPFALFGVSLGGLIAFELARALSLRHHVSPMALCIAACRAPHLPGPHVLDDGDDPRNTQLIGQMMAAKNISNFNSLDYPLLPMFYADTLLGVTYAHIPGPALDCPITLWGGIQDEIINPADLGAWQTYTRSKLRLHWLPGNHFFVRGARVRVRARLLEQTITTLKSTSAWIPPHTPLIKRLNYIPVQDFSQ